MMIDDFAFQWKFQLFSILNRRSKWITRRLSLLGMQNWPKSVVSEPIRALSGKRDSKIGEQKKNEASKHWSYNIRTKGYKIIGFLSAFLLFSTLIFHSVSCHLFYSHSSNMIAIRSCWWLLLLLMSVSHEDLASITYYLCDPVCAVLGPNSNTRTHTHTPIQIYFPHSVHCLGAEEIIHGAENRYDCKNGKRRRWQSALLNGICWLRFLTEYMKNICGYFGAK